MDPQERYRAELRRPGFTFDPAQELAVGEFQRLYLALTAGPGTGLLNRLLARVSPAATRFHEPVRGLYLWGGVGRGKTYLMDLFFESLPPGNKLRTHFHRFMQRVHHELRDLAGHKNPLKLLGERIARETRVLCFDEFFVADITDAMILAGLLEELFARGVTLVATSNVEPDGLYRGGLQRQRFLPAIALLKQHARVINVDGGIDHRLRLLEQAELFHCPLDERADESLMDSFNSLAPEPATKGQVLEVEGRTIVTR